MLHGILLNVGGRPSRSIVCTHGLEESYSFTGRRTRHAVLESREFLDARGSRVRGPLTQNIFPPQTSATMYRALLLLVFAATATGRLFRPKQPVRISRPALPEHFSVNVTFVIPMLAQIEMTLFVTPKESCFRTELKELRSNAYDLKEACERFGLTPTEDIYFPLPLHITVKRTLVPGPQLQEHGPSRKNLSTSN